MISVIIVTWNSEAHIGRCLASLPAGEAEIMVVDNASQDGTAQVVRKFPHAKLIEAGRNLGFAAACNLGAKQSTGELLLFLNPDTELRSQLAGFEVLFSREPNCVAAGARLLDEAGTPQAGFLVRRFPTTRSLFFEVLLINRLMPNNPVNRRYRCLSFDPERPTEVDQPAGAALAVRRSAFEAVGGFDERFYPLWFEDVDLCLRLKKAGGNILYAPQITFAHRGGHSLEALAFSEKQVYWYRNLIYYVGKNLGWWADIAIRGALLVGLSLRAFAELSGMARGPGKKHDLPPSRTQPELRTARAAAYWRAARVAFESSSGRSTL